MDFLFLFSAILIYLYAFVSGFTDAAQAIASAIGSRSLSPTQAIIIASIMEIIGALTGTAVAITIGKGIVSIEMISLVTVPSAILGCLTWSLICYKFGIPVSETHGLIGALIGASLAISRNINVINYRGLIPILLAIIIAPVLGFVGGYIMMKSVYFLFQSFPAKKMKYIFINLQRIASAYFSFSHGRNDAQKPMGMLLMLLMLYYGWKEVIVPYWVIISVGIVAGLGVAYGGWRIIKTLGMRITKLTPEQGFISDFSGANVLQLASQFGIPVSTTHVDASSVFGVGAARRISGVRWEIVTEILISWILTLPLTIIFGIIFGYFMNLLF
ncbi:MAG: inorganic phosphate transporter [Candidatus Aenigmatarchaeota archaeon]